MLTAYADMMSIINIKLCLGRLGTIPRMKDVHNLHLIITFCYQYLFGTCKHYYFLLPNVIGIGNFYNEEVFSNGRGHVYKIVKCLKSFLESSVFGAKTCFKDSSFVVFDVKTCFEPSSFVLTNHFSPLLFPGATSAWTTVQIHRQ